MIEGAPIPQDPKELNQRLHALYALLPSVPPLPTEESTGLESIVTFMRPDSYRIMAGVREILPYACITSTFKRELLLQFEILCEDGTEIDAKINEEAKWWLDQGFWGKKLSDVADGDFVYDTVISTSQNGGGIFDPNEAMKIERIAYRRELLAELTDAELSLDPDTQTSVFDDYNIKIWDEETGQKWREEFIELYHEEP